MTKMTSQRAKKFDYPGLKWWQWQQLERQGCHSSRWEDQTIDSKCDLSLIRNVEFEGVNTIGVLDSELYPGSCIVNATLHDCVVKDGARIKNIGGEILNATVEKEALIENVGRIEFQPEASCGIGTVVAALDETGSRPVVIYPGLSAQAATVMAREPRLTEENIMAQVHAHLETFPPCNTIGEKAAVKDCGSLFNVCVGNEVKVIGAKNLKNGTIVNNSAPGRCLSFIGAGVDADGFIVEDGVVDSGVTLRNVYVGQGVRLEKGFTAHDSLFFANCSMENGEACAVLAGPYTVSMHKGSLLIGCQTSFMNAGSGTNQSNHAYKLGPVHWGLLERGVKTSSNSYLMHGASIGTFSLLMGSHKTHPNSTEFPFSYLFGDEKGATVVVPAMMLRSCGLMRDEMKWPTRDRRLKRKLPLHDKIIFEVLNPFTIDRILRALDSIEELLHVDADDDRYIRYKGMKISKAALERAKKIYTLAVFRYLDRKLPDGQFPAMPEDSDEIEPAEWVDVAGLIMPRDLLNQALEAESVEQREEIFTSAFENYPELEMKWIGERFGPHWRLEPEKIHDLAEQYDQLVETDRAHYREQLQAETDMLKL